jgi:archaemetzincin
MKTIKKIFPLFFASFICITACEQKHSSDKIEEKKAEQSVKNEKPAKKITTTIIQPFSDISAEMTSYIFSELKKICSPVILKDPIPLPDKAFYADRNRYRADTLLNYLESHSPEDHVTIGLTSKDISCTVENYPDWGIIGYGYCPGGACVVSTYRLSKRNTSEQLFKAAIHELGHTQGLGHCPDETCFMRDAEGKNTTDEEIDFCPQCTAFLQGKGWQLQK